MNKIIQTVALFCMIILTARSQDSLSLDIVKKYTYVLTINGNSLGGQGWDSLRKDIAASQFVLLGENHSSPKLSELTALLLPAMKPLGYRHFIIETGPMASQQLKRLYNKSEAAYSANLHRFLSDYKLEMGSPPAEFLAMKKDVAMYKAAFENGYSVQGIDKEYYSGYRYLFAELYKYCNSTQLKTLHRQATARAVSIDSQYLTDKKFTRIAHLQQDSLIQFFLAIVATKNKAAAFIADQMRKSWQVYRLYESKNYYTSEAIRIQLLKKNFGDYYYRQSNTLKPFKAFIKYGNVHTVRGESYLGHADIGNLVSELAALNGNRSLHIQNMRRFRYNATGEIMDFLDKGYEVYPHIIMMTDKDNWVLIDLQPLKELLRTGKLKAAKDERLLILQNDWVLLAPVDGSYKESLNYE